MNRAETALQFISPVERETWVTMGMALRSEFGDAARDVWLDWSRQADSFRETDARAVWRSFRGTGVSIASLYHEARQNGWRDEGHQQPTFEQREAQRQAAAERQSQDGRERARLAQAAARKADWILGQCKTERHAYTHAKGFTDMEGLVWWPADDTNLLCVPMHVGRNLVGLQLIDRTGSKKFLSGQVTSQAEYCFHSGTLSATDWWVEGFASGLSLRACLDALKLRYRIHVTFSAGNLKRMAHSGYVVADNDASGTGLVAAQATGLPYFLPPAQGFDINDMHQADGTFKTSQAIRKWLQEMRGIHGERP